MNERKDERWLDEQLRRAINTTVPEFDAETWKREHAEAYQALVSRGQGFEGVKGTKGEKSVKGLKGAKVRRVCWTVGSLAAAAAVILLGATILLMRTPSPIQHGPVGGDSVRVPSPAHIVSMLSLRTAYRQGGEEALYQQLDTALETLGPRPDVSSTPLLFGRL